MIHCPSVSKRSIRAHYDWLAPFYRLLWGPHIHHGLWPEGDGPLSPGAAQRRLIDHLAAAAEVGPGQNVLDVGCGTGGSSIELVRRFGCRVTGLTLSPVQRAFALFAASCHGVVGRMRFRRADVEAVTLPAGAFNVVWVVECSEHLFDKPAFFRRAAGWLRSGGRLAVCAWLAGDGPDAGPQALQVCEGFLCPSLGTAGDYLGWIRDAGMQVVAYEDLTDRVAATWEVCIRRLQRTGLGKLSWLLGKETGRFADSFQTLLDAYRSGAMRYGMFVARKG
jgi:tocopherol O-methyltransferase